MLNILNTLNRKIEIIEKAKALHSLDILSGMPQEKDNCEFGEYLKIMESYYYKYQLPEIESKIGELLYREFDFKNTARKKYLREDKAYIAAYLKSIGDLHTAQLFMIWMCIEKLFYMPSNYHIEGAGFYLLSAVNDYMEKPAYVDSFFEFVKSLFSNSAPRFKESLAMHWALYLYKNGRLSEAQKIYDIYINSQKEQTSHSIVDKLYKAVLKYILFKDSESMKYAEYCMRLYTDRIESVNLNDPQAVIDIWNCTKRLGPLLNCLKQTI